MKSSKILNLTNKNLIEKINEYKEYILIKDNIGYIIQIIKNKNEIIFKHNDYENKISNINLSLLTKNKLNTLDESFSFISSLFEENKVIIKKIIIKKEITLILKIINVNKEQNFEITLLYNKKREKIKY